MEVDKKFDHKFQHELLSVVDDKIKDIIADQSDFDQIDVEKKINFSELEFRDKQLKAVSDKVKK